jgi:DNA-binding response OmpR family regulator
MEKINKRKLKIMIIEDEEDILILYKDFLSGKGHDVTTMYLNGDVIIERLMRQDLIYI